MSTPPASLWKLSKLDPLTSDPGAMRFAVVAPAKIQIRDKDAKAVIRYRTDDGSISVDEAFYLVSGGLETVAGGQSVPAEPGRSRIFLYLGAEDALRMRNVQSRIRAYKESGLEGGGSFSFETTACRTGVIGDDPVRISAYLQTDPDTNFFALFRNQDLRRMDPAVADSLDNLELCDLESGLDG